MSAQISAPESLVPVVVDFEGQRWPMFKAGAEPLCKDTDLAAWLQYARPRKIRELIDRWANQLGPVERPMAGRPDATEDPVYLTEEQALFIIAKSETPRATWMLKAMIQVFLKARGLVAVAPVDSFGQIEEWNRLRQNVDTAGRVLVTVTGDISRLGSEQARQRELLELLEARVCRGQPTKEEREELVRLIDAACACRLSAAEKRLLLHVAQEGPATSRVRMAAAAGIGSGSAQRMIEKLSERALLDAEQRDPNLQHLRNYYVISESLQGHAADCEITARRALDKMKELTAAVHVVPPNIPRIPVPQVRPQLQIVEPGSVSGQTDRELFVKLVSTYGKLHDYQTEDYHRAYNRIYAALAVQGLECRGKRDSKGRKVKPADYIEARGWAGHALAIARELFPLPQERRAEAVH